MTKKKPKKMIKNSLKTFEKYSLYVSLAALFISLLQLILTSPLIVEYFSRAELVVSVFKETNYPKVVNHSFAIANNGKNTATNIEVEIHKLKGDEIQLIAETRDVKLDAPERLVRLSDELTMEKVYLTAKRLTGGDHFMVNIQRPKKLHNAWIEYNKKASKIVSLPFINNAFCDQGRVN